MGQLAQFLLALTNLVRSGAIKKIPQAIKFAEQQFGKVTPLLKKQIEKVFESAKKPVVGKPGKKEGAVIPMVKEGAKKAEGIETLDPKMGDVENLSNPKRPGGSLDPATGITRALARRILDKKGIEIGKKDPIDVFTDTFGEAITDVKNLADEMIEAEQIGRNLKSPDELLEIEGLFDIEIPKNPQRGLTDKEMLELEKQIKEEKILDDFDPTFRKPNAEGGFTMDDALAEENRKLKESFKAYERYKKSGGTKSYDEFIKMIGTGGFAEGGLTRTSYALGKGPVLPEDPTKPINPFAPKPTGPVLPDKSMTADLGDEFISPEYQEEFRKFLMMLEESDKERSMDNIMEMFKKYMLSKEPRVMEAATGGRVQAASGGLAEILKV
jgi:hypothetical protein